MVRINVIEISRKLHVRTGIFPAEKRENKYIWEPRTKRVVGVASSPDEAQHTPAVRVVLFLGVSHHCISELDEKGSL